MEFIMLTNRTIYILKAATVQYNPRSRINFAYDIRLITWTRQNTMLIRFFILLLNLLLTLYLIVLCLLYKNQKNLNLRPITYLQLLLTLNMIISIKYNNLSSFSFLHIIISKTYLRKCLNINL